LPTSQTLLDLFRSRQNVRDIRLFRFSQRRRDADDDRVTVLQLIKIRRGVKTAAVDQLFYLRR
jgi:hypothetical protein